MQGTNGVGDRILLSDSVTSDIPVELRGVEMPLVKQVGYSRRYGSTLYSAKTMAGESWIVRGDWFDNSVRAVWT